MWDPIQKIVKVKCGKFLEVDKNGKKYYLEHLQWRTSRRPSDRLRGSPHRKGAIEAWRGGRGRPVRTPEDHSHRGKGGRMSAIVARCKCPIFKFFF